VDVSPDGRRVIFQSQQVLQENIGIIDNMPSALSSRLGIGSYLRLLPLDTEYIGFDKSTIPLMTPESADHWASCRLNRKLSRNGVVGSLRTASKELTLL
jgi:hypothetical protein